MKFIPFIFLIACATTGIPMGGQIETAPVWQDVVTAWPEQITDRCYRQWPISVVYKKPPFYPCNNPNWAGCARSGVGSVYLIEIEQGLSLISECWVLGHEMSHALSGCMTGDADANHTDDKIWSKSNSVVSYINRECRKRYGN